MIHPAHPELSKIIKDWNARYGTTFKDDIAAGLLMSLFTTLTDNPNVQQGAKVNNKNHFRHTIEDLIKPVLTAGYSDSNEWYTFLLNHEEVLQELTNTFSDDCFDRLKAKGGEE